jgi:hypothetical protein
VSGQLHALADQPSRKETPVPMKLIVGQLIEKVLAFYGSRRLVNMFIRTRHWILQTKLHLCFERA